MQGGAQFSSAAGLSKPTHPLFTPSLGIIGSPPPPPPSHHFLCPDWGGRHVPTCVFTFVFSRPRRFTYSLVGWLRSQETAHSGKQTGALLAWRAVSTALFHHRLGPYLCPRLCGLDDLEHVGRGLVTHSCQPRVAARMPTDSLCWKFAEENEVFRWRLRQNTIQGTTVVSTPIARP